MVAPGASTPATSTTSTGTSGRSSGIPVTDQKTDAAVALALLVVDIDARRVVSRLFDHERLVRE
jgi:curli biogenesis system outer membrane secretion channel CsgG